MYKRIASPGKWHGGKSYLANRVVALMPPHLVYCEPYFGMGSVLLARDPNRDWLIDDAWKLKNGEKVPAGLRGASEIVNDIDSELTNFWQVLQSDRLFAIFHRQVQAIPFSEVEWDIARHVCNWPEVEAASRFFVRCRQSLAGRMKDFASISKNRTRRGMNEQASAWMTAVKGLPAVAARLKRVVILNQDAIAVIKSQDAPETLFYCDPPYLAETRASGDDYEYEMTEEDHAELLRTVRDIKGKFILSGYRSKLYDWFAKRNNWGRQEFDLPNNAAGGKSKRRMTECVWMNY